MTGSKISEMSERRILGGNQHALPSDIFAEDLAYAALGHLHLPQRVGSEGVRYSGSPIPLSLSERGYRHQVLLVELAGRSPASITPLLVPRAVELLRVPESRALPLIEILPLLEGLPVAEDEATERWPFLEVHVALPAPEPTLRADVEKALEGRRVRLVRLQTHYSGSGAALGDAEPSRALRELQVEEVFQQCWQAKYEEEPDAEVLAAFAELVEQAQAEGG
jgi:exonuclease SbcD